MNRKINNLEELLQEKARLQAQLRIVQEELNASAQRTRREFKILVDERFSLGKQLGHLFQGGAQPLTENTALRTIGQVAGGGAWWSGIAATLLPVVIDFVRQQIGKWKQKRAAKALEAPAAPSKGRKLFSRKPKTPPDAGSTPAPAQ